HRPLFLTRDRWFESGPATPFTAFEPGVAQRRTTRPSPRTLAPRIEHRARAIARSPRPPRSLPKTRATGATRWLKTRHPTIDCGCGPRSIEPLTVDLRSRRPLTELCCAPAPP